MDLSEIFFPILFNTCIFLFLQRQAKTIYFKLRFDVDKQVFGINQSHL